MLRDYFLVGMGIALSVLTYFAGKMRGKAQVVLAVSDVPKTKAICPCGHTIGEHEDLGNCLAQICRPLYLKHGGRSGNQWVACACTRYYGPKLISADEFFSPGMVVE